MAQNRSKQSNRSLTASGIASFLRRYSWVVIKNILGWLLILAAFAVSGLVPAPVGFPMFIIGFGLVTFPGKRHLTSRVLRGIPIQLQSRAARIGRLAASLVVPPVAVWILAVKRHPILHPSEMSVPRLCALYAIAMVATWIFSWVVLLTVNLLLKLVPRVRRRVRPWLRRHGIRLLPPRKKRRPRSTNPESPEQDIMEIDPKEVRRFRRFWKSLTYWI